MHELTIARMAAAMGAATEREKLRDALRWYGQGAHALACNFLAADKKAVMATLEKLALDGGKRAAALFPEPGQEALEKASWTDDMHRDELAGRRAR